MNISIDCPFCGEPTEVDADIDLETREPGVHQFVRDCDVCCNPISVSLKVEADGEIDLSYARE